MVKDGLLFICERCGKEKFVERTHNVFPGRSGGGYTERDDKWLCPTCTELYNKMMNNFFAPEIKRPINLED